MSANLRVIGAAVTLAALTFGSAEAADANAVWLANEGQARIKVQPCGSNLCGTIVWLAEPLDPETGKAKLDKNNPDGSLRSRPILGLRMLEATPGQEGQWRGTIYNGQNGQTYDVRIRLEDAVLEVKGCVLGGLFCSTQKVAFEKGKTPHQTRRAAIGRFCWSARARCLDGAGEVRLAHL